MKEGGFVNEGVDKNGEVCCGTCKGNPYFSLENDPKRLLFSFSFGLQEYKLKVDIAQLFGT